MKNYIVGILGNQRVGRSTLINHYIPNAIKISESDQLLPISEADKSIHYYKVYDNTKKDITFVDTPSIFNQHTTSLIEAINNIEYIFDRVNNLDYIILCISATKHGIREIDLEVLKILYKISHALWNRIFIYITKTDLLNDLENDKFMKSYLNNNIVSLSKIFSYKDIDNINTSFVKFLTSKNIYSWHDIMEMEYKIPIINKLQSEITCNKLYTKKYIQKHSSGYYKNIENILYFILLILVSYILFTYNSGILNIISCLIIIVRMFTHIKWLINNLCFSSKYDNQSKVTCSYREILDFTIILYENINEGVYKHKYIEDSIFYSSGELFFKGTLYGNQFNKGIFYNKDGTIFYEKKL